MKVQSKHFYPLVSCSWYAVGTPPDTVLLDMRQVEGFRELHVEGEVKPYKLLVWLKSGRELELEPELNHGFYPQNMELADLLREFMADGYDTDIEEWPDMEG